MTSRYTKSMKHLFSVQAQQTGGNDHCSKRTADSMAVKSPFPRRRPHREQEAIHDVAPCDNGRKQFLAAHPVFFGKRQRHRDRSRTEMAAGGESHIVELASLTKSCVDKRDVQSRRLGAVVDDGALRSSSHVHHFAVGDFVPLRGGSE